MFLFLFHWKLCCPKYCAEYSLETPAWPHVVNHRKVLSEKFYVNVNRDVNHYAVTVRVSTAITAIMKLYTRTCGRSHKFTGSLCFCCAGTNVVLFCIWLFTKSFFVLSDNEKRLEYTGIFYTILAASVSNSLKQNSTAYLSGPGDTRSFTASTTSCFRPLAGFLFCQELVYCTPRFHFLNGEWSFTEG